MTSASSWASAARGWISSTTSEPCVEARRRRLASGPLAYPRCCCAPGVPLAAPPVFRWLRHRCSVGWAPGVLLAVPPGPPARRPRRELRSARRLEAWPGPAGPPARRSRRELRSARRLEARPCPAAPPAPSSLVARGVRSLAKPFVPCHTLCLGLSG